MGVLINLIFSRTNLQDSVSKPAAHDFNETEYKVTINGYFKKTSEKELYSLLVVKFLSQYRLPG